MLPLLLTQKDDELDQTAHAVTKNAERDFAGIRVMVVDDAADSREMLRYVLEDSKAQILTTGSAIEALDRISAFKPDILISDLGMPEMDGYDLIRKIRAFSSENGGRIPAIALTGYVSVEEQRRVHAAGFDVHVAKPVDFNKLLEIINNLLHQAGRIR